MNLHGFERVSDVPWRLPAKAGWDMLVDPIMREGSFVRYVEPRASANQPLLRL